MRAGATVFFLFISLAGTSAQILPPSERKPEEKSRSGSVSVEQPAHVVELSVDESRYIVGPNDLLNISVFAERFYSYDVTVSSNGRVIIPMIGEVDVADRTLAEAREIIGALIRRNFRNAELTLSLVRARGIKVSVTGAVREPGVITLPATGRVSEALALAGGPVRDTTALRGITVRRGDSTYAADLLAFLRNGDVSRNPFLMGGDVVHFPRIDERVGVFGAVNYEGHLDWLPGERLFDYLRLAGGFRSSVFLDSVQVVRFLPDHTTTRTIHLNLSAYPADRSADIPMEPGDMVFVRAYSKFRYHRLVVLKGEVRFPGTYTIELGVTRLSDIIMRAGGFTDEASLEEATVTRAPDETERDKEFDRLSKIPAADMREDEYEYFKDRSRERVGQIVVDFRKLFIDSDQREDVVLHDKDVIEIPVQKNFIRVMGRINNPGNVIFRKDWDYRKYVDACNGFGWRADDGDVRVVKGRTGEFVDAESEDQYRLEPGDTIWVPEDQKTKFWEVALTTLAVLSQIAGIVGIVIAVSNLNN